MHLVGYLYKDYHDARSLEHKEHKVTKEYFWKDNQHHRSISNVRLQNYAAEFPTTNPWCPIRYVLLNRGSKFSSLQQQSSYRHWADNFLHLLATSSLRRSTQHLTPLPAPSTGNDVPDNICWSSLVNSKSQSFGDVLCFHHQDMMYSKRYASHMTWYRI
jgi:hypothetical protein